jgi:hypothetical protein
MKLEFSGQIFEKSSNIKFHVKASSGIRVVSADRQADVTNLVVAFRNFANASKMVFKMNRSCTVDCIFLSTPIERNHGTKRSRVTYNTLA